MSWHILKVIQRRGFIFLIPRAANFAFILLKTVLSYNKIHTIYMYVCMYIHTYIYEESFKQVCSWIWYWTKTNLIKNKSGIMHIKHCKVKALVTPRVFTTMMNTCSRRIHLTWEKSTGTSAWGNLPPVQIYSPTVDSYRELNPGRSNRVSWSLLPCGHSAFVPPSGNPSSAEFQSVVSD